MSVLARGADDRDGVGVDERAHVHEVNLLRTGRACLAALDVEVLCRLIEGGMCCDAHHDVRLRDAALGAPLVAVRLHRHQDRFGATRREGAAGRRRTRVHTQHHADHLRLHLPCRRMD